VTVLETVDTGSGRLSTVLSGTAGVGGTTGTWLHAGAGGCVAYLAVAALPGRLARLTSVIDASQRRGARRGGCAFGLDAVAGCRIADLAIGLAFGI